MLQIMVRGYLTCTYLGALCYFFLVKRPFKEAYLGMNTIISSYILEVDLIIISSGISVSQQKIVLCLLRIS